jgi:hypothetical protein
VAGHADVQVTTGYRADDVEDYWGAATEALQSGRFVVGYIGGASPYPLWFRRYDVAGGGWMSSAVQLDYYARNVRRAGQVTATEGGTTQGVAWLAWDYNPSPGSWSINWARVRADGTYQKTLDVATNAAAPAGAAGTTSGIPAQPRVLLAYVSGSIWNPSGSYMECGSELRVLIYDAVGTLIAGPILVDGPVADHCFAGPSVSWSSYDPRFHITYQYRGIGGADIGKVWWRHKYVTAAGGVQGTPDTLWQCAGGYKSVANPDGSEPAGDGTILTGAECHRHNLAFDPSSSRNTTNVFAFSYYGAIEIYNQSWTRLRQEYNGSHGPVERALSAVAYSYQTISQFPTTTNLTNPKYYDDTAGAYDVDAIGSRACSLGGNRGGCYRGEAISTAGSYSLVLYGEWNVSPPRPLFLSVLDAS